MKRIILAIVIVGGIISNVLAQTQPSKDNAVNVIKETDILKSNNSQEMLTNLFHLGINNLLGSGHSFTLNSSLYGIDSLLSKKGFSHLSTRKSELFLRTTSINIGAKGDKDNNISTFSVGATFNLINHRDVKYTALNNYYNEKLNTNAVLFASIKKTVNNFILSKPSNGLTSEDLVKLWKEAGDKHDYTKLDAVLFDALKNEKVINAIDSVIKKDFPKDKDKIKELLNFVVKLNNVDNSERYLSYVKGNEIHKDFQDISRIMSQKALLTCTPTYSLNVVTKQAKYAVGFDYLKGISGKSTEKPWEIEFKAHFNFKNDSLNIENTSNLNDQSLTSSIGVNKILKKNKQNKSSAELKMFFQYYDQMGLAHSHLKNMLTANVTFRLNIYESTWLPITLSYDKNSGKIFGFLSLTADLSK